MSARDLATLIRDRKLSAREVMAAYLRQINRVNLKINAIVAKLDDDKCLALADEADRRMARRERVGPLHGLPIAFKDLEAAVGFPWTRGSRIYKDDMPMEDTVLVERLRKAGALPIGKTNVPEFGMGSQTYNEVYGTTVNPYDVTKTPGGSSGGASPVGRKNRGMWRVYGLAGLAGACLCLGEPITTICCWRRRRRTSWRGCGGFRRRGRCASTGVSRCWYLPPSSLHWKNERDSQIYPRLTRRSDVNRKPKLRNPHFSILKDGGSFLFPLRVKPDSLKLR